jgi:hypothetical protein
MLPLIFAAVVTLADTTAGNPNLFTGLTGTWSCKTAAGSFVTQRYAIAPNGDVDEHMDWKNGVTAGSWDQVFSYDATSGVWNVKNVGSQGIIFTGTIRDADGNVADIVGTQRDGDSTYAYRERYVFETPSSFSHAWESQASDGSWRPTSFAECSLTNGQ